MAMPSSAAAALAARSAAMNAKYGLGKGAGKGGGGRKGGGGAGGAVDPTTGLTQAQLAALVTREVNAQIAPARAQLGTAETQANHQYGQEELANSNLAKAYAQLLGQIAPRVSSAYGDAANSVADYGKGFSDVIQAALNGGGQQSSELLAAAGAPAGQQAADRSALTAPTDALYGMGGVNPATALQSEGAAAASAAAQLPAVALASGQQNLRSIMSAKGATDQTYATDLAKLLSSIPGLRASAENSIIKDARSAEALNLEERRLGLETRTQVGNLTGVDPVTGLPTQRARTAQTSAQTRVARAHASAIGRRDSAVSSVMTKMLTYVNKARHATGDVVVGHEPVLRTQSIAGVTTTEYLSKDGQYKPMVGNKIPGDAVTRPIYQRGSLPAPAYKQLHDYVYSNLQINLSRFGYSPQQIEDFTQEIVGPPPPPPAPAPKTPPVNLGPFPVQGQANPLAIPFVGPLR